MTAQVPSHFEAARSYGEVPVLLRHPGLFVTVSLLGK